MIKTETFK